MLVNLDGKIIDLTKIIMIGELKNNVDEDDDIPVCCEYEIHTINNGIIKMQYYTYDYYLNSHQIMRSLDGKAFETIGFNYFDILKNEVSKNREQLVNLWNVHKLQIPTISISFEKK
jgi:hypothetical protein